MKNKQINSDKLIEKMAVINCTFETLAQDLNLSHKELFLKIIGFLDFYANEMSQIVEELHIPPEEASRIFGLVKSPAEPCKTVSVEIPEYMLEQVQNRMMNLDVFANTSITLSDAITIILLEGLGSQFVAGY